MQGQGYRFLVPVTESAKQERRSARALFRGGNFAALAAPRNARRWGPAVIASGAVALVLILVSVFWLWRSRRGTAEPEVKTTLAVLPFENFTGDPGQDYFSDGLTEEMISQLGDLDPAHLRVIARTSVMHYKHSQESIPQIGKELGGAVCDRGQRSPGFGAGSDYSAADPGEGPEPRLGAGIRSRSGAPAGTAGGDRARSRQRNRIQSLSGRRRIEPAQQAAARRPGTNSYEAYDLYLKGRYLWNKRTVEGFRQAADYFQQAIDKDPNYRAGLRRVGRHVQLDEHMVRGSAERTDAEGAEPRHCGRSNSTRVSPRLTPPSP